MGTPAFAVPSLRAAAAATSLIGVVSQPDRPRGRGLASQPSPVAAAALALGAPLVRPATLRTPEVQQALADWRPDVLIVAAYGKLLPPTMLTLPTLAPLNVHASLLPRHRGAAPIAAAIRAGDDETGVTIMLMTEAMDAGDVLLQRPRTIGADDTTESLTAALAELGAEALTEALALVRGAGLVPVAQDAAQVTYAPRLTKEDGRIDWSRSASELARTVRAFAPWPSAFTTLDGRTVKILAARPASADVTAAAPGTIVGDGRRWLVVTGEGALELMTVQAEGRKPLPADVFAAGARLVSGSRFE